MLREGEARAHFCFSTRRLSFFQVLAIALGSPPKPDDKFLFEFYDKDGKFGKVEMTPLEFSKVRSTSFPRIHSLSPSPSPSQSDLLFLSLFSRNTPVPSLTSSLSLSSTTLETPTTRLTVSIDSETSGMAERSAARFLSFLFLRDAFLPLSR